MEVARRVKSTHIATRREVTLDYVDPRGIISYPSDWFLSNPDQRPTALVPRCTVPYEDILRAIKGGIRSASLNVKTVKVFLREYGKKIQSVLVEPWESFGITIGEAGSTVTPWSIVKIREEHEIYTPTEAMFQPLAAGMMTTPDDPQNWTELSMALFITCIYRLSKVTNEDYADLLQKRMEDQVKAEGGKGMSFHGTRGIYGSWLSDTNFLKMIAAYDMLLHRFAENPMAILRMGTLGSRFRDCAALLSVGYALNILNVDSGQLMDWMFLRIMGDEIVRMTHPGEEVGDPYSYFPYQADMGLVRRSAYSSNANPYVFTWIHLVGSLLGHKRSQNARFIFEGSYADIGLNAVLITWVYSRGGELIPQFAPLWECVYEYV